MSTGTLFGHATTGMRKTYGDRSMDDVCRGLHKLIDEGSIDAAKGLRQLLVVGSPGPKTEAREKLYKVFKAYYKDHPVKKGEKEPVIFR